MKNYRIATRLSRLSGIWHSRGCSGKCNGCLNVTFQVFRLFVLVFCLTLKKWIQWPSQVEPILFDFPCCINLSRVRCWLVLTRTTKWFVTLGIIRCKYMHFFVWIQIISSVFNKIIRKNLASSDYLGYICTRKCIFTWKSGSLYCWFL